MSRDPLSRYARARRLAPWMIALAWLGVLCSPAGGRAMEAPSLEQRVKAAYLYQFAGYVQWPATRFAAPDTPVTIAVLGADALAAELEQVATGRRVAGRAVSVRRLRPQDTLAGVHILFIGHAEHGRLAQLTPAARSSSVLTVTESDGALERGSIINFVIVERRVRFEIALDAAEKGGLRLSSRLLAVAEQVRRETP